MIYKDGKEITSVNVQNKVITAIYKGARLVWQGIKSCFGAGYWIGDKPWISTEPWKN